MNNDMAIARQALNHINPADRETWFRMGAALKSAFGEDGFDLWDGWSQDASSYKKQDAQAVWKSISEGGGINFGSLIHEAKQNGFQQSGPVTPLSPDELEKRRQERAERERLAQAETERKHIAAQMVAKSTINSMPRAVTHKYLTTKGVRGYKIYRLKNGDLAIPMRDVDSVLWSVQTITPDGKKLFLKDGRAKGLFHQIGSFSGKIVIAEGYATGASIHEATGYGVAVAFSAGNLDDVAVALRSKFQTLEIIVAGDLGNGSECAIKAANVVNGRAVFPTLKDGKDFNDLHKQHGLSKVKEQIDAGLEIAQEKKSMKQKEETTKNDNGISVNLVCAADMEPKPIRWMWDGWLAHGKLHILAGQPGTGKTTIAVAFGATATTGGSWPDGTPCTKGNVLVWSGEDDSLDGLLPKFLAQGADKDRLFFIKDSTVNGQTQSFDPARHMAELADKALAIGNVSLLIVDPIVNAVSGDGNSAVDVRRSLQPLVELAARLDAVVLGISHFTKGSQGQNPLERVSGSGAFGALARVVMAAAKNQDDDSGSRMLMRAKSNIGPDGGGFNYLLELSDLPSNPTIKATRVRWGEQIEGTARELLATAEIDGEDDRSQIDQACDWLRDRLEYGRVEARLIFREGEQEGFNKRTLQRARKKIGATSGREGFGKDMRGVWSLDDTVRDHTSQGANVVTNDKAVTYANRDGGSNRPPFVTRSAINDSNLGLAPIVADGTNGDESEVVV